MIELNPKNNPIIIKCTGSDRLPIDLISEFQGKLKKLSTKNRDKLMQSICLKGFIAPFFVWDDTGDYKLLDGHGRLTALLYMRQKGWDLPMFPVVVIDAAGEQDAREKLLAITSQYGEFDINELTDWVSSIDSDIAASLCVIDSVDVKKNVEEFEEEFNSYDDKNCDLPIVPNFFEHYEFFIIPTKNKIDEGFVRDFFGLNENFISESGDKKERKTNVINLDMLRSLANG